MEMDREMDEKEQIFAYERYLEQRKEDYGVYREDIPYSPNLDLIVAQVNLHWKTNFSHRQVWQAIAILARKDSNWLHERGLRRETDVPFRGGG